MQSDFVLIGVGGLVLAAVLVLQGCRHRPTPEERMESFIREKVAAGYKTIFRDQVEGKPLVLLLEGCKVYRLDVTGKDVKGKDVKGKDVKGRDVKGEEVTQSEVLRPGFVLWFTGCVSQKAWREGEYIFAELVNQQVGAGGGNASGGTYRSRNAVDWEKQVGKKWLPVAEAQQ
jgi:hypothetical protein